MPGPGYRYAGHLADLNAKRKPLDIRCTAFFAVVLLLLLALFTQARLEIGFTSSATGRAYALAVARLLTLPLLLLAVLAVGRAQSVNLLSGLAKAGFSTRIVLTGIASGVLMRVATWSELTARGSFGLLDAAAAAPARPFRVAIECPEVAVLLVTLVSRVIVVPLTEEIIHRGVVQAYLYRLGSWPAILGSTGLFTLTHEPGTYVWIAILGLLFALQYFRSGYLWLPLITHASYNGLNVIDEHCLQIAWNPPTTDLPLLGVGSGALCALAASLGLTALLTRRQWVGRPEARGPVSRRARWRRAR